MGGLWVVGMSTVSLCTHGVPLVASANHRLKSDIVADTQSGLRLGWVCAECVQAFYLVPSPCPSGITTVCTV